MRLALKWNPTISGIDCLQWRIRKAVTGNDSATDKIKGIRTARPRFTWKNEIWE